MKQILINVFLGMLPEVLFFTMFIIYAKNIKEKRWLLFGFIILNYLGTGILSVYSIYSYVLFMIFQYVIIKILYKEDVEYIDIFLITISHMYLFLISLICYKGFSNYNIALLVNRLLLIVPFLLRNKLNYYYKKYRKSWNRSEDNKIRSISLRNMSLITLNLFIFVSDIVCIYISSL